MIALLADTGLPPLGGSQLFSTQFEFVPVAMIVIALGLYLWGVRRNNALHPRHPWPVGKTIAWIGALFTTGIAIFSFVGVYDGELFWDHMIQHLILIMVAAPLFAVASPLRLAFCSTSGTAHIVVTEALRSRVARFFGNPIVAFILYAVVIPISHLTVWYNYTLTQESVHNAEHLTFLLVGYLFWRQIFGNDPNAHRLHPALQFFYLFMAIPIDTFTGLSLAGASHELFPAYFATHRTWGLSYVTDLHVGGDIMWVVGDTLMLWPMIPVAIRWMHMDERRAVRVDRELDELAFTRGRDGRPSPAEVHQFHADPVGVGAVEKLEGGPAEIDGRPTRFDDGAAELDHPGCGAGHVAHPEGEVGQSELVDGPPFAGAERRRLLERQELNGGGAAADELRRDVHVGKFHQAGEFGSDGVRLRLLEAEGVAVEAQRALQVAHADAEVRKNGFLGVVHAHSLPRVAPVP